MISNSEKYGEYTFVTISETGRKHQIDGKVNQDAVKYMYKNNDFILAVADGVGTCVNSAIGSKNAVMAACEVFRALDDTKCNQKSRELVEAILRKWFESIPGDDADSFCTTLKIAIKYKKRLMLISIGDGLIGTSAGNVNVISPDLQLQFINQTHCLNQTTNVCDFWIEEIDLNDINKFTVLACTDGISNCILDGQERNLIREIDAYIDSFKLKGELESFVTEISEYTLDDKTIGVVKYEG